MPTLEEFFEEAIEQADPENMVENKYKYVNLCVSLFSLISFVFGLLQKTLCITNICSGLQECTKIL